MSDPKAVSLTTEEILERIHLLQGEICDREERIAELVDTAREIRPTLEAEIEDGEERRRIRHLERLMADWDTLVARSRALTDDDLELVAALARLVGDLLAFQPDGLAESWIENLEFYLEEQRAQVS